MAMKVKLRNPERVEEVPGPAPVWRVLERLAINPETVLVIHDGTLVTKDVMLPADAEVEVRPVISGGAGPARCHACSATSVIEVPRNRAAYCPEHFVDHVRGQVREAISRYRMLSYDDRILVAVSGGKDSLALWDVLLDMGYRADGLYLGLGIGGYSSRSEEVVRGFADRRGATLHLVDLAERYGFDIPAAASSKTRSSCGVCGLSKRYVFNQVALEHGYDVMATGHNLDDEAAQLLGNVLRWQTPFMARQSPFLPASPGQLARKVKPLYRLGEREMAAYCVLRGLDYVVEECPMVGGNTVLRYKDVLNELERTSPGTKAAFLFGFLDRAQRDHFASADTEAGDVVPCGSCGLPTTAHGSAEPVCAFCRTRDRLLAVVAPAAAS
jgi:tRNA-5-methyluridine54 2-sulfurtransferase